MACAAAFPVPSMMGADELAVYRGLPTHHVHGTTDWMFDISQVREADDRASKVPIFNICVSPFAMFCVHF